VHVCICIAHTEDTFHHITMSDYTMHFRPYNWYLTNCRKHG